MIRSDLDDAISSPLNRLRFTNDTASAVFYEAGLHGLIPIRNRSGGGGVMLGVADALAADEALAAGDDGDQQLSLAEADLPCDRHLRRMHHITTITLTLRVALATLPMTISIVRREGWEGRERAPLDHLPCGLRHAVVLLPLVVG